MNYLLMIHIDPDVLEALTAPQRCEFEDAHARLQADTKRSGELVTTQELADAATAVTVRAGSPSHLVSDGPYAETKEFMGGYYLLDVDSPQRAVELAQQLPEASLPGCAVEIRAVV